MNSMNYEKIKYLPYLSNNNSSEMERVSVREGWFGIWGFTSKSSHLHGEPTQEIVNAESSKEDVLLAGFSYLV